MENGRGETLFTFTYFDSNDMACLLEAHFKDLSTGPTADLPLTYQICDFRWIPLEKQIHRKQYEIVPNVTVSMYIHLILLMFIGKTIIVQRMDGKPPINILISNEIQFEDVTWKANKERAHSFAVMTVNVQI